jgi:hypothetical protein
MHLANQYEKVQISLELNRNAHNSNDDVDNAHNQLLLLQRTKDIINETKDKNVFIPTEITALFPIICHINIFSFINKMEMHKIELIHKFRSIKTEIRYILRKLYNHEANPLLSTVYFDKTRYTNRINRLYTIKHEIKLELNNYRYVYEHLDILFTREIKIAERKMNKWGVFYLCFWRIATTEINLYELNPVLDKYIQSITPIYS